VICVPFDYKKEYKDLYMPKTTPALIDVPEMTFIMVDGEGDPNTSKAYQSALEVLYGLSFTIKMSKMKGVVPDGYFDCVVAPLEGLWWTRGQLFDGIPIGSKDEFCWTAMIRQPEFVTPPVFEAACAALRKKKKPDLKPDPARLESFAEGLCAQLMHIGPYDDAPRSIALLEKFITESGYKLDLSTSRRHHEIYLGDPRKTAPDKLRTVIRHPIK
jgi:hypothetical protein